MSFEVARRCISRAWICSKIIWCIWSLFCNIRVKKTNLQKIEFRTQLKIEFLKFYTGHKKGFKISLFTCNKSTNLCWLADEFDFFVENEENVKLMSPYCQRRFTKLGYSAVSILKKIYHYLYKSVVCILGVNSLLLSYTHLHNSSLLLLLNCKEVTNRILVD